MWTSWAVFCASARLILGVRPVGVDVTTLFSPAVHCGQQATGLLSGGSPDVPARPHRVVASIPMDAPVYAATESAIRVLHGSLGCVEATIPLPVPVRSIALAATGTGLYVTGFDGSLSVINADNAITTLLDDPVTQLAVDDLSNRVYVTNFGDHTVSVIDGATDSRAETIGVGAHPEAVAINPVGACVYVGHYWSSAITVIAMPPGSSRTGFPRIRRTPQRQSPATDLGQSIHSAVIAAGISQPTHALEKGWQQAISTLRGLRAAAANLDLS